MYTSHRVINSKIPEKIIIHPSILSPNKMIPSKRSTNRDIANIKREHPNVKSQSKIIQNLNN